LHTDGNGSWRIDVRRDEQSLVWALWIRAAERIDVPDHDSVPGPLDIDPLPAPGEDTGPDLGRQWLQWWLGLLSIPRDDVRTTAREFGPPNFSGAADWRELQTVIQRRWPEAEAWRRSALAAERDADRDATWQVIDDVTRAIDRPLRPFSIEILTVPVRDDTVRMIAENRYLVADRLLATRAWRAHLDRMIRRAA
jgi:hypothetical protein